MAKTLSSFNRKNACVHNQNSNLMKITSRANRFLDEAVIMRGIIRDFFTGDYELTTLKDLEQTISDSYVEIDDIDVTQTAYEHNLAKQIFRRLKSETRQKYCKVVVPEGPLSIDLYDFMDTKFEECDNINVNFDVIIDDGKTLEGIIHKTGVPKLGATSRAKRSVNNEIPLYLMLRVLRELIPAGQKRQVIASYYYMKKTSDTSLSSYGDDYFDKAPVRSLVEDYTNLGDDTPQPMTDLDVAFKELLEKYAVGYEKNELDEETDCKNCPKHAICFYKPIPEKSEEVEIKAREEHTPTEEQQKIIDARDGIFIVNAGAGSGKTETAIKQRTVTIVEEELQKLIERYENGEDIDSMVEAAIPKDDEEGNDTSDKSLDDLIAS